MEFKASERIAKELQRQDVWSMVNGAAAELSSPPANLGQGFMDFSPPAWLIEAAKGCFDTVATNQYSPTRGRPRLMEALAKTYSPMLGRTLDPKTEIVVTAGANEGFYSAFAALLDHGDEVVVMEPFFDQYISNIEFNGGRVRYVRLKPPAEASVRNVSSRDWKLDIEELKAAITPKTKILMLNTPHNPIGKIFTEQELREIGQVVVEHNLIVLSDEVYDRLDYSPQVRFAALAEDFARRTITIGSAGKTFGCTGWRVGWLIGTPELIRYCAAAHTRICFVANSPLQEATAIAFERAEQEGYYATTVGQYKRRLDILCETFDALGLPYTVPDGSYFLLVNFAKVQVPEDFVASAPASVTQGRARDFLLCYWLLKQFGVVSIPTTEFCTTPELENFLRFAFCKTEETLLGARDRLQGLHKFIKS